MKVTETLLSHIKLSLRITWKHQDDDFKKIISQADAYIVSKCGKVTYEDDTIVSLLSLDLLTNLCRYSWNGAKASFENDYLQDIIGLQLEVAKERRMNARKNK